jgi:RecA-family ATPase
MQRDEPSTGPEHIRDNFNDADDWRGDAWKPPDGSNGIDPPHPGANGTALDDGTDNSLPPLVVTSPVTLQGVAIPDRRWVVDNWIPIPLVTGIYGDGGMGKSLLLQMLLTSAALGRPWLGLPIGQRRALAIFCEDPEEELQRRQADINRLYGVDMRDLGNMRWLPRFGMDNLLMEFDGASRRGKPTPFYRLVTDLITDFKPEIILVDTVADTFGGNENDRQQARFFVQVGLGSWARMIDGSVLASAHPSRSGLKTGDGDSGSTAWNAAFRSRLYLSAPKQEDAGAEAFDTNERTPERRKANYAPRSEIITLRWQEGIFIVKDPVPGREPIGTFNRSDFDHRVLREMRAMIEQGAELPLNWASPHGFANTIRKRAGFEGYRQRTIIEAQERLIKAERAVVVAWGPPTKRRRFIRPADMPPYPSEKKEPEPATAVLDALDPRVIFEKFTPQAVKLSCDAADCEADPPQRKRTRNDDVG